MTTKTFSVSGMKCAHCKAYVEKALESLQGVAHADADLALRNVTVHFDAEAVTPIEMKNAVESAGYDMEI